jgi:CRP/FNR family transcriptional regulator
MRPDPERLRDVSLFTGVSDEDLERIAGWMEVEVFSEGRTLAREGQSGYEFWVIDEGSIRIEREGTPVAVLGPGEVLGELTILGDGRRKAAAVAETDVRIFSMFGTHFREMQTAVPLVDERLQRDSLARLLELGEERSGEPLVAEIDD